MNRNNDFGRSLDKSGNLLRDWRFLLIAGVFLGLVGSWPIPWEFLQSLSYSGDQDFDPEHKQKQRSLAEAQAGSLNAELAEADRLIYLGNREEAHKIYQRLLARDRADKLTSREKATLFLQAAGFYLQGEEIPQDDVEKLLIEAYVRLKPEPDYQQSLEVVHRSLEQLYVRQRKFSQAATQARLLLAYYSKTYADDVSVLSSFDMPVMMRLAGHLIDAENVDRALAVYQQAVKVASIRGSPTSEIEARIDRLKASEGVQRSRSQISARLVAPPGLPPYMEPERHDEDLAQRVRLVRVDGVEIDAIDTVSLDRVSIKGHTASNIHVAKYLRQLQNGNMKPTLDVVTVADIEDRPGVKFSITVRSN